MAGNTAEGLTRYTVKGSIIDDKGGPRARGGRSIWYSSWGGKDPRPSDEEGGDGVEELDCCCGDFDPGSWFELSFRIAKVGHWQRAT